MTPPAAKTCASCGRTITWRKKWAADWDSVRYCSQACRRAKVSQTDRQLEESLLRLLTQRAGGAGVSPDEAAADVGDGQQLRERARAAARRLTATGAVQIIQDGRVVDPSTARGPFLVRRTGLV